jgi:hypothetical protein
MSHTDDLIAQRDRYQAEAMAKDDALIEAHSEAARLRRNIEQAHEALDLLEPCPPRQIVGGARYTLVGRIDWYREHQHEVWVRSQSVEDKLYDVPGRAGVQVIEWLERERRPA